MAAEKSKRVSPTLLIVISMVAGFIVGLLVGNPMNNVKFIGDIFFHLVQMGIVPFVMCTIIEAIGGLTAKDLSDIGIKGIIWFAASSILASAFGIACTLLFQPGAGLADSAPECDDYGRSIERNLAGHRFWLLRIQYRCIDGQWFDGPVHCLCNRSGSGLLWLAAGS